MLRLVLDTRDIITLSEVVNYAIDQVESSNGDITVLSDTEYNQLDVLKVLSHRISVELEAIKEVQHRKTVAGINWVWYYTDTEEDAIAYFKELTGKEPSCGTLVAPVVRTPAAENDDKWGFRIHR